MKNVLIILTGLFLFWEAGYLAFNGLFLRPDKVLTVRFKEVPPIIKLAGDVGVYYRGYKVGKATCRNLSKDQQYILFCIQIDYKDLKLPANTEIILKTQDLFGDRYFDLVYPENPSAKMLAHGDVIDGTAVYERVDKYLVEQMEEGKLGELITNLNYLAAGVKSFLEGDKKEIKETRETLSSLQNTLKNIDETLTKEELTEALKQTPELLDRTITNIEAVNRSLPGIDANIEEVNTLLCGTNQQLECLNPKIPVVPQELVCRANRTLMRYDCIGGALSDTMSKNCLFFRFLFGRPGESFKECGGMSPGR